MNKCTASTLYFLMMFAVIAGNFSLSTTQAEASEIPDIYTNKNFWSSTHDKPLSFKIDTDGNFSGLTETGKTFTQKNIANGLNIRLQRFSIDEAFYYVSDRGIIVAQNNMTALSIYLNRKPLV